LGGVVMAFLGNLSCMYKHVYRTHGMICGIKVVTEGAHRHAEVRAE